MTISHNPTTAKPQPAKRGKQGYGQTRVDLNAAGRKPPIPSKRKRV
jgi:hypothetical protein